MNERCQNPNCTCNQKEKEVAEKEVSPQTNATLTVLTPGPDAAPGDFIATPEGNIPNVG